MRAAAVDETSGLVARVSGLTRLAASPTISTSLVSARRKQLVLVKICARLVPAVGNGLGRGRCQVPQADRSSGRIQEARGCGDIVAEVQAETLVRAEFDLASDDVLEFELHLREVQQAWRPTGLEFDQDVDVAGWAEVLA